VKLEKGLKHPEIIKTVLTFFSKGLA